MDPDHCSHTCQVPLSGSTVYQSLDELAFERGIWYAAQHGDLDKVQKLLEKGANVDETDAGGYTALHYASRNGHLHVCRLLVRKGANVNRTTRAGGATALQRAASAGKVDVVKFLLESRADCSVKDGDNKTVLHRGAEGGSFEICEAVLRASPGLRTEVDNRGKIAADYARSTKLFEFLRVSLASVSV